MEKKKTKGVLMMRYAVLAVLMTLLAPNLANAWTCDELHKEWVKNWSIHDICTDVSAEVAKYGAPTELSIETSSQHSLTMYWLRDRNIFYVPQRYSAGNICMVQVCLSQTTVKLSF